MITAPTIRLLTLTLGICLALFGQPALAVHDTLYVTVNDDIEIELRRYPAEGETLLVGFPCDQGTGRAEEAAGEVLSSRGIEVRLADLLTAHFLPIAPSSMRSLPGDEVAALISDAEKSGKRIVLIASGYGAVPALRGARVWQQANPQSDALAGAILFFPMLTAHAPEPGKPIEYLPIVSKSNLPIVIMQPGNSPTRFWANQLAKTLRSGGSEVTIEILPKVRSRFYARADASEDERAMAQRLPELVEEALAKLTAKDSQ